ncbi:ATP-binding cassette domain-containing protein [Pasteurella skyensis]|uniref:ATP-binding cassette domain-containing protein n=1 Tax=Phocoenobacter skyensis TaxID=97481 RepID=A0AAJ6N8Y2_9PAST|nr:ATP-binding cassette domain-containing protein [Pasteurella skyensis]MDP8162428.1 ATP-binding cassette domain-containing protein [Pasteurella skyensis]MDP8172393.1 ATP-binding cassette domain-containing protein [Pasteurella skyensis]MDP8177418.1 ATP-binding cassette domain-containing protein [Pasteurella skyensis]MDP8178648.1 ATP-binding cassette domain-containing protein [Pasteurella skyensis]MDP8183062.1 ATP-binding cassette domain-containing protein [Pasteurella skyensis]
MQDKQTQHNWQLPLQQAVILQTAQIGVGIVLSDIQSLNSFDALANTAFLTEELQLDLQIRHLSLSHFQQLQCPVTVKLKNNHFATVLKITKKQVIVASDTGVNITLPLKTFLAVCEDEVLLIRKNINRMYNEQGIDSEKKHWFWSVFNQEYPIFTRVLIASFFANLLAIVASLFSLQVYDRVIPNKSEETLWALLIGVLLAMGLEAVLRTLRSVLLDHSGKRVDLTTNGFLLRHLLRLRLSANTPPPNYLTQMMREFASVREFFTEAAVGSLVDIPFAFLFLFVIYAIGGNAVWVPILASVAMILPAFIFRGKMRRIVASAQGAHGAANRLCNEVAYNLESVKVTQSYGFFEKQWNDINVINANVSTRQRYLVNALTQWAMSMQQLAYVITITVATYAAFEGKMTMGGIIALNILVSRTLAPMTRLSSLFIRWAQVKSSLKGLESIAQGEQDDPITQKKLRRPQLKGHLSLQNVEYSYEKEVDPAIQIGKLTIRAGEKVAILGPNGSGKSTLLKLLSGLYFTQKGEIKCDGLDMRQISERDLRRNINYFTQEVNLFNGTLRQNITFDDTEISDDVIIDVLQQTGLGGLLSSHPHGLDLPIKDGGIGLSVGQKQSVQIARMLLGKHNILLLDEPTASLDPNIEARLIQRLKQFSRDKTLILVTHRMPILELVDRIIVISNSRITADGSRDEILQRIQQVQKKENGS